ALVGRRYRSRRYLHTVEQQPDAVPGGVDVHRHRLLGVDVPRPAGLLIVITPPDGFLLRLRRGRPAHEDFHRTEAVHRRTPVVLRLALADQVEVAAVGLEVRVRVPVAAVRAIEDAAGSPARLRGLVVNALPGALGGDRRLAEPGLAEVV